MKGYRTILFNALMLIVGLTGTAMSPEQANEIIEAFMVVWAGGNAILRAVTSSKMFKKD